MKKSDWFLRFLLAGTVLGLTIGLAGCSDDDDDNNNTTGSNDEVVVLQGTYVDNMTLTADNEYLLRGGVFIGSPDMSVPAVLTIEPGTVIYGESSTNGMLVINRGSKIMAEGTASAPIVFTSDKAVGSRTRSDWGGLIINGQAPLNSGEEAYGEGGTGSYGGALPHDNSGVLKYVRVEFAGREISPDNELNGIAFQGVGDGTTVDYIQVHKGKDDGVEFFGGTVCVKHVLISGCADDCFDWTDGWQGKAQFVALLQHPDAGDQGIEADNNAEDNDATPRSFPTLYNVTILGAAQSTTGMSDIGMLLREGTGAVIQNAIITNMGEAAIDVDHEATFMNAWDGSALNGNLVVDNCIFYSNTALVADDDADMPFTTADFVQTMNTHNHFDVNPGLMSTDVTSPNLVPTNSQTGATPPSDGFFDASATYIGAFGSTNWAASWTTNVSN